jgi:hypothetical protein
VLVLSMVQWWDMDVVGGNVVYKENYEFEDQGRIEAKKRSNLKLLEMIERNEVAAGRLKLEYGITLADVVS